MEKIAVIGGGIGGLGTAALLAKEGYAVTVFEKNGSLGGVCNRFATADGFVCDTGPSWYMMPEIYEHFFGLLGEDIRTHLDLMKLDPSYRVFFEHGKRVDLRSDLKDNLRVIEEVEPGAGDKAREYLAAGKDKYLAARKFFLHDNFDSLLDFANWEVLKKVPSLGLFETMDEAVSRTFASEDLRKIFHLSPSFLGGAPWRTPALFTFMNYVEMAQGVWYPKGGMYEIVKALVRVGEKYGVRYRTNAGVRGIETKDGRATAVVLENGERFEADAVVSNADWGFTETNLLSRQDRMYSREKWNARVPSFGVLIMYLGVKGKVPELAHHNAYFADEWRQQFKDIEAGQLSRDPSIYIGAPSVTDETVAPADHENLFVLVPIPAQTDYKQDELAQYADFVLRTIEGKMKLPNLRERIVYKKIYASPDFAKDYNLYRGSLGPAQTLFQSAWWRPNNVHGKVKNLYFVGASTSPGIGVPTCLISAERVWKRLKKNL